MDQLEELRELTYCADVPATVGGRARIVLWYAENRPKKEIATMAGVSRPTVDLWLARYAAEGVAVCWSASGAPDGSRLRRASVPGFSQQPAARRRMGCRTGRLGRW